ncbi:hypothetical protein SLEP1_g5685 [Rubroshorea leprosula]|uniref:Ankyrin repeat protein n=1 Tax=Rubroshorea leprosula TaxID=152421 RepID=A0AAV5HX27_9ROSI|nr:hypothetical protein SLEP1_g5685 [Rubroshorea leprosula]
MMNKLQLKIKVVRELLKIDKDLARVQGKSGNPLHLAADQALDLLVEFLEACPEYITDVNIHGQTAFQVAVKNKSYEAAKLLASWICRSNHKDSTTWERVVLNEEDHEGNTVLQMVLGRTGCHLSIAETKATPKSSPIYLKLLGAS